MTIQDFPTRIHPFDLYALISEIPSDGLVDVIKKGTYPEAGEIIMVAGRTFVQTTTVPVITDGGKNLW